jgi:hypothetical protein
MAPQYESLPLITKYGSDQLKSSRPGQNKMRRVSSIQKELGPTAQRGTASTFNVGINLAKTAGMNGPWWHCIVIINIYSLSDLEVLTPSFVGYFKFFLLLKIRIKLE